MVEETERKEYAWKVTVKEIEERNDNLGL